MEQSDAPESWEQDMETDNVPNSVSQVAKSFSSLNVDAKTFVPGQNIFAREFVPTWTAKPASQEPG